MDLAISAREQPHDRLLVALLALTFVTGMVDGVSFLGLGRVFTANMTGNIALLGFAVAGARGLSIAGPSVSLLGFLIGAVLGGRLAQLMINAPRRRWVLTAGVLEALVLFGAAAISVGLEPGGEMPSRRLYAVIVLTAAAMGFRTATVRRFAVPDMTTTVLTQTLTAVAAESSLAGGTNPRLGRRVAAVLLLLAGAATGVLLMQYGLALPLFVSGTCALVACAWAA